MVLTTWITGLCWFFKSLLFWLGGWGVSFDGCVRCRVYTSYISYKQHTTHTYHEVGVVGVHPQVRVEVPALPKDGGAPVLGDDGVVDGEYVF